MASVSFTDIRKSFGPIEVVHGVDIDIPDGAFVVLVGPSGCGKSTLLKMLAGLERVSAGEIRIGEQVVNDLPPKKRDIAMVFQNYALYPHMTVEQNIGFGLKMRGVGKGEIAAKVKRSAETLGLDTLLDRYPRNLSGGQRQRVAMGRAIVRDPQVFLFDEPLSNLDAQLRVQMRAEIKRIHQLLRTTIVYVTHDQIEAMTLADIIVVLRDGNVEQVGSPLEVFDRPANRFVAGFIGSPAMNFLPIRVVSEDGLAQLSESGVALPIKLPGPGLVGRPLLFGVRPEHFALSSAGIPAEVVVSEPTGSEEHLILRLGTQEITVVFRERLGARPGTSLHIAPQPGAVHVFDAESGLRIDAHDARAPGHPSLRAVK